MDPHISRFAGFRVWIANFQICYRISVGFRVVTAPVPVGTNPDPNPRAAAGLVLQRRRASSGVGPRRRRSRGGLRDGNSTRGCGYPRILNPMDAGAGLIFHPWVDPHPHPHIAGAGADLRFHPRVDPHPSGKKINLLR